MFIPVAPDSTSFARGYPVVLKCLEILGRCCYDDVDVEMKESQLFNCTSNREWEDLEQELEQPPDLADLSDEENGPEARAARLITEPVDNNSPNVADRDITYSFGRQLSEYIGTGIASSKNSNIEDGVIGHVEFSSPMELGSHGRLRDWVLVELYQDKHATPLASLRNRLPITFKFQELYHQVEHSHTRIIIDHLRRHGGEPSDMLDMLMHVRPMGVLKSELIPEDYLQTAPSFGKDYPGMIAVKHGAKSDFTLGVRSGIESVTCPCINGPEVISDNWCILTEARIPFSSAGDEGSFVFDVFGRVGSMITGGLGRKENPNRLYITYVTPMNWILEDIKVRGYEVKLA
ncbi:hypothetical protein F53441_5414 [Fusarium austroafricanum]|uniref:Uncharacterized protein n=1 Tax=Fusarium austroafricanum TaxID=2364996 RepID=A0A8H4KI55_9HYPO|nr:hypothetical protein F53441_5414 [Fusarium austroafricanum]